MIKATVRSSYSDLRESGYRTPRSNLCDSSRNQNSSQHCDIFLPKSCILLSDWTTSCVPSLYCTPSSYWHRTRCRIFFYSSAGALPLPKKMRRNNYDSEDKYYIFFRFKSLYQSLLKLIVGDELSFQDSSSIF